VFHVEQRPSFVSTGANGVWAWALKHLCLSDCAAPGYQWAESRPTARPIRCSTWNAPPETRSDSSVDAHPNDGNRDEEVGGGSSLPAAFSLARTSVAIAPRAISSTPPQHGVLMHADTSHHNPLEPACRLPSPPFGSRFHSSAPMESSREGRDRLMPVGQFHLLGLDDFAERGI
jgi:hypothetical protein